VQKIAAAEPPAPEKTQEPKPTPPKPAEVAKPVETPIKTPEKIEPPKTPEKQPKPTKTTPKPPKPQREKPNDTEDLDAILKSVKTQAQQEEPTEEEAPKEDKPAQKAGAISKTYDASEPLSNTEMGAIIGQIQSNWNVNAGAKDDYTLVVTLRIVIAPDGTVQRVSLEKDMARAQSDPVFAAAADRAMKAVRLSSPLKNLPADKYDTWKDMVIVFDPSTMLY